MTFAPTCPFCSVELPDDDPNGDRHQCSPVAQDETPQGPQTILQAALYVAQKLGCYVFELDHPDLPTCAGLHGPKNPCDGKRGKHPAVKFSLEATNTARDITARFAGSLRNYGVETRRSRLLVIDEDTATLDQYAQAIGVTVPETFQVSTGRGRHLWFRAPTDVELTNATGALPAGIDVRAGSNGYVVGPESKHANGNTYTATWGRPILPAPDWLVDALLWKRPSTGADQADTDGTDVVPGKARRLLDAAVTDDVNRSERFYAIVGACKEGGMSLAATVKAITPWCRHHIGRYLGREEQEVARIWGKFTRDTRTSGLPDEEPPVDEAGQGPVLDEAFWASRPYLTHIRDAAHSRQRSAPAVLGVVLARVAAMVDHRLRVPAIVGSDAGLSLISAIIASPGIGKSTASAIGSEILPAPDGLDIADNLPLGTGEGMAELYFGTVEGEPDARGKTKPVRQQIRHNAFFYVDEGQVLGELGTRKNATLLPTIRTAFTGGTLGQMNASEEKRRILPAGSYTMGLVVALQEAYAGPILDDAAGGTPQRLLWWPAFDETIRHGEHKPRWPGRLPWRPPSRDAIRELRDDGWIVGENAYIHVAKAVRREIEEADLDRQLRRVVLAPLDAHEGLLRLKVAALLAILDGRLNVDEEDWQLATAIKAASDACRDGVIQAVKREAREREEAASARLARRAVRADKAVTESLLDNARSWIRGKVYASPGRWRARELHGRAGRRRPVFYDALELEVADHKVEIRIEPGQGGDQKVLWPAG